MPQYIDDPSLRLSHASRTRRLLITVASGIAVLVVVASILLLNAAPQADLALEVGKLLVIVGGNVTVGGLLSLIVFGQLAERDRELDLHHQRANSLTVAQRELKEGFDCLQMVRYLLKAEPTAATLVDQLPGLFAARELLQRAERERFVITQHPMVQEAIQRMLDAITLILNEIIDNATELRLEARRCERAIHLFREGSADDLVLPSLVGDNRLPNFNAFIGDGTLIPSDSERRYCHSHFLTNYRSAKDEIEAALIRHM